MYNHQTQIPEELISALQNAGHALVLTGSGISAESGVPTFRDAQTGLWAQYDPHELATPQAFRRDPRLVWEWYTWRRQLVAQAKPNPAHYALAQLQRHVPHLTLITQNVDGLHQQAGSQDVVELHGNITRTKCFDEDIVVDRWQETGEVPPRCLNCGGLLRPDVVWFGESLPQGALEAGLKATQECDLFFSIGTSAFVQPAASFGPEAKRNGALLVEVNLAETPLTGIADYFLRGQAGEILPRLLEVALTDLDSP
jgi:NAD-dependent deacetylase